MGTVLVFILLVIRVGFVSSQWLMRREVGGVRQYSQLMIVVHSAVGCCTATSLALTYIKQMFIEFAPFVTDLNQSVSLLPAH